MRLDWNGSITPGIGLMAILQSRPSIGLVSSLTLSVDYPHIGPSSIGLVSKVMALGQSQRGSAGNRAGLTDIVYQGLASNLLLRV